MTKVPDLPEIDALEDADVLYVWDASAPGVPDKKLTGAKLRPVGAKITRYTRSLDNVAVPTIAAGAEADVTITVADVLTGDVVTFTPRAALAAGLGVTAVFVAADGAATIRFRNFSGASIAGGVLAYSLLAVRSL